MSRSNYSKHPLVIDVETISYEGNYQRALEHFTSSLPTKEEAIANWKPAASVKKQETIDRHREEFVANFDINRQAEIEEWADKRALYPGENQIIAISVCDPLEGKADAYASDNEADVLCWWLDYVRSFEPQSIRAIGFNVQFDLLTIMFAMHRHGLSLNRPMGKWDKLDLFYEFGRRGGLKTWAMRAGCHLSGVDGSKIKELYEAKDWKTIHTYAMEDARNTCELYYVWSTLNEF